jgi:hypothetical protein
MSKCVFVSYSHRQGDWVWDRLVPVLRAGGVDVRIDRERFKAGKAVIGQMDTEQDAAEISVLVLSGEYLASAYCQHEMRRACARDPTFSTGSMLPVLRADCALPPEIDGAQPLRVDLRDDSVAGQWDLLLDACEARLGAIAPAWLAARAETRTLLKRGISVNLVVKGQPAWRELLDELREEFQGQRFGIVDLENPSTTSRRGLVVEVLRELCGTTALVPQPPEDLVTLSREINALPKAYLVLKHFDRARNRQHHYEADLFSSLRYLASEPPRKLVLLIQSRQPFAALLPEHHGLSSLSSIQTVELVDR